MDAPLLNRFEKQFYTDNKNLSKEDEDVIENLEQWMDRMNCSNLPVKKMFPCVTRMSLQTLVLNKEINNVKFYKNQLIQLAS